MASVYIHMNLKHLVQQQQQQDCSSSSLEFERYSCTELLENDIVRESAVNCQKLIDEASRRIQYQNKYNQWQKELFNQSLPEEENYVSLFDEEEEKKCDDDDDFFTTMSSFSQRGSNSMPLQRRSLSKKLSRSRRCSLKQMKSTSSLLSSSCSRMRHVKQKTFKEHLKNLMSTKKSYSKKRERMLSQQIDIMHANALDVPFSFIQQNWDSELNLVVNKPAAEDEEGNDLYSLDETSSSSSSYSESCTTLSDYSSASSYGCNSPYMEPLMLCHTYTKKVNSIGYSKGKRMRTKQLYPEHSMKEFINELDYDDDDWESFEKEQQQEEGNKRWAIEKFMGMKSAKVLCDQRFPSSYQNKKISITQRMSFVFYHYRHLYSNSAIVSRGVVTL